MKCPHCTVAIHANWTSTPIRHGNTTTRWRTQVMACPACSKIIVRTGEGMWGANEFIEPVVWVQVFPQGYNRGPVPTEVPKDIASDYDEASLVLASSPKASAALSRRCLQTTLARSGVSAV